MVFLAIIRELVRMIRVNMCNIDRSTVHQTTLFVNQKVILLWSPLKKILDFRRTYVDFLYLLRGKPLF